MGQVVPLRVGADPEARLAGAVGELHPGPGGRGEAEREPVRELYEHPQAALGGGGGLYKLNPADP